MTPSEFNDATMPKGNAERRRAGGTASTPWWEDLSAHSDRDDVREVIARLIREGEVWVRPRPGDPDRVEVIPHEQTDTGPNGE